MFLKKTFYKTYKLLNSTQKFDKYLQDKNVKITSSFVYDFVFYYFEKRFIPFEKIEHSIIWINSFSLPIRKILTKYGKQPHGIGEGETILNIINPTNSSQSHLEEYDLNHTSGLWEVKKGIPILSGGSHKSIITDFVTVLTLLDKCIQNNKYLPTFLKYASISIQYNWNNNFIQRDIEKNSFTNISKTKFDRFFQQHGLLEQIQLLHQQLNPSTSNPFEMELQHELNFIFKFIIEHNITSQNIRDTLKQEFIQNLQGLICVDGNYNYEIVTQREFLDKWCFDGITKSNRVRFKPYL